MGSCLGRPKWPGTLYVDLPQYRFQPIRIIEGRTEEILMERYATIENTWKSSEAWKLLCDATRNALQTTHAQVETCVCFGTFSMNGRRDFAGNSNWLGTSDHHAFWEEIHNTALLQIAAFKSAVDTIGTNPCHSSETLELIRSTEHVQSKRPKAYAQDPTYNMLDTSFLSKIDIMRVDSPNGWDLLDRSSFAYCPPTEHMLKFMAIKRDPALFLSSLSLDQVRDTEAAHFHVCPGDDRVPTKKQRKAKVGTIEKFMAEHDSHKLPAHDNPGVEPLAFQNHVLYWLTSDEP